MIKLRYRAEIDTLRAIAVTAVIIYHAKIIFLGKLFLPGGFLGVDIFFVISGYLISSLIYKEFQDTKTFSFKNFYERRARRILPALIIVILASIPLAWLYVLPTSFVDYAKSILFSIGFTSNLYFYFTGQIYGAESGLLKPLLHTWSLSIEEQYYLIFPIFFYFIYTYFKKNIFWIILITTLISLLFATFYSEMNPALNFYILLSRVWELLAGTILLLIENVKKKRINHITDNLLIVIGLAFIFFPFFLFENASGFPNLKTLCPILGVMLVVYFSKPEIFMTKLLSNKISVGVGLISYSLYLWHYPIFAYSRIGYLAHDNLDYILTALLIFSLSILTYFFIEKPFRSKKKISLKFFLIFLSTVLTILIATSLNIISKKGYEKRFPFEGKFHLDNLMYKEEVRLKKYELGSPNFVSLNKKKILIYGNSHGRDFFNLFALNKELFSNFEFSIMDGQVKCLTTLIEFNKLCKINVSKKLLNNFAKSDVIIISQQYSQEDLDKIEEVLKILKKINKRVILTSNSPDFYFKNSRNLIDEFYYENKRLPNDNEKILLEEKKFSFKGKRTDKINEFLKEISKKNNIQYLNKEEYLCSYKEKKCYVLTDKDEKINTDSSHLTLAGAKFFGKKIFESNWLNIN